MLMSHTNTCTPNTLVFAGGLAAGIEGGFFLSECTFTSILIGISIDMSSLAAIEAVSIISDSGIHKS